MDRLDNVQFGQIGERPSEAFYVTKPVCMSNNAIVNVSTLKHAAKAAPDYKNESKVDKV